MKVFKYIILFLLFFVLFSFAMFSFIKAQEYEKDIDNLNREIKMLEIKLGECQ